MVMKDKQIPQQLKEMNQLWVDDPALYYAVGGFKPSGDLGEAILPAYTRYLRTATLLAKAAFDIFGSKSTFWVEEFAEHDVGHYRVVVKFGKGGPEVREEYYKEYCKRETK